MKLILKIAPGTKQAIKSTGCVYRNYSQKHRIEPQKHQGAWRIITIHLLTEEYWSSCYNTRGIVRLCLCPGGLFSDRESGEWPLHRVARFGFDDLRLFLYAGQSERRMTDQLQ